MLVSISRPYLRCCVVCLAERLGSTEQPLFLERSPNALILTLPLCARHGGVQLVTASEPAHEALWITRGDPKP